MPIRLRSLAAAALTLLLPAHALADDIAELAPPRSFLVVSIPDWAELTRTFKASDLGRLWEEPSVKSFVDKLIQEPGDDLAEFLGDANVELQDLAPPAGQLGLALYLPAKWPEMQPWEALPNPHLLIAADLGDNADAWEDALERLIDHGTAEKHITTETETFAGVEIRIIKPIYEETNTPADGEDDEMDFQTDEATGGIGGFLGGSGKDPRNLYIGRVGNTLVAASEMPTLESAIDALSGKDQDSIADSQDFRDAALQRRSGELAYAAFLPAHILTPSAENSGAGAESAKMLGALGLSSVKAVSMGLRLDTQDALVEATFAVLAPEKTGLLTLLEPSAGAFEPPAFVPPDAADISTFNVNFARIPDLVRAFAAAMPEEQRQFILGGFDQMANIIVPTLEAMGPGVHYITSYRQPLAADSSQVTFAVDLKDPGVVTNTMTFVMGQVPGAFEPRDFEGNTIYSAPTPVGTFALGIGFGRLFIGQEPGVENAMRLAGRVGGDGERLADEPRFRDAARLLAPGGVAYSYTDMEQTLRWTLWEMQNAAAVAEKEYEEWLRDMDEADREEFLKGLREGLPEWVDDLPPAEVFLRYIGDSITEMESTTDGFRGRSLILRRAE